MGGEFLVSVFLSTMPKSVAQLCRVRDYVYQDAESDGEEKEKVVKHLLFSKEVLVENVPIDSEMGVMGVLKEGRHLAVEDVIRGKWNAKTPGELGVLVVVFGLH